VKLIHAAHVGLLIALIDPALFASEIDLKLTTSDGSTQVSVDNAGAASVASIDSAGNVNFKSTLMPNGQPGTAGQVLQSQGAGASPLWVSSTTLLSGDPILNQSTLQNGSVFYVSSASVDGQAILARNSGNVGVGTDSPNDKLEVAGSLRFLLDLKPNGQSGTAGQLLESNGPGAAPVWVSSVPLPTTLLDSTNTWTAQQIFAQSVTVSSNILLTNGGILSGDGSGLINLPPSSISAGTLPSTVVASSIAANAVYPAAVTSGVYGTITGIGTQTQNLNLNSNLINNLGTPIAGTDAATKSYVDIATSTLLSSTNSWTAQQTFTKQVSVSTSLALSGSFLANGASGSSGQLLQSQGGASAPAWISSTTLLGGTALVRQGSASLSVVAKSGSYAMTTADFGILGDATSGAVTITLPAASNAGMLVFVVKKDSTGNNVNIAAAGGDSVNGSSSISLTSQYQKRLLIADGGTTWYVISQ